VPGAADYIVYRTATPSAGPLTVIIAETSDTKYTDANVTPGTTYYYAVAARNSAGTGAQSAVRSFTAVPTVPGKPIVDGRSDASGITLTWGAVPGAADYVIYRTKDFAGVPQAESSKIAETAAVTYTDVHLAPRTTYYYTVAARNGAGTGAQSAVHSFAVVATVPGTPELTGEAEASGSIFLSWDAAQDAAYYVLYRTTTPPDGPIAESDRRETLRSRYTDYLDFELTLDTTYYYAVAAQSSAGIIGGQSAVLSFTVAALPGKPTASGQPWGDESILIWWLQVPGAADYVIYRTATPSAGPLAESDIVKVVASTGTPTQYEDTGLTVGVTYYYAVAARRGDGRTGEQSDVFSVQLWLH
jgi:fibronectin type 3 domain-containing protein